MTLKEKRKKFILIIVRLLITALAVALIFVSLNTVKMKVDANQLALYGTSVRQYAAQCYAIEGFFPEDIAYLEENYGLNLNTKRYVYHYEYFGSNIMPDIRVFILDTK